MKKATAILSSSVTKDLSLAVMFIPLWWFLGVRFFIFHLFVVLVLVKFVVQRKTIRKEKVLTAEILFLLGFIGIYLLSLIFNLKNIPLNRIFASLNNLSFWGMGLFLIYILKTSIKKEDIKTLTKAFTIFGFSSFLFSLTANIYWLISKSYLQIQSPLYKILPQKLKETIVTQAHLIKTSLLPTVVGRDKLFQREFPRTPGFNIYGTAFGFTMIIVIGMTYVYYRQKNRDKKILWIIIAEIFSLFLSLSRMAILAFLLALILVFVISRLGKKWNYKVVLICGVIAASLFGLLPWKKITDTVAQFRGESTSSRLQLYDITLSQAMKKPIFGYGFKPRTQETPVPVGSHSTYIGVIYRTGFLGFGIFIAFWFLVVRKWWLQKKILSGDTFLSPLWYSSGVILFGGLFWMITEDLDAPPIAAFLYFLVIGLVLSLDKLKESSEKQ